MAEKKKRPLNKSRKRPFYKSKGLWLSFLLFIAAAGVFSYVFLEQYTRPYRERAETYDLDRINDLELPSIILDRNDEEIGRIFLENRSVIGMDKVPKVFVDALVAGEDSRFAKHGGIDYWGIIRAAYETWKGNSQGASTITQQLARNAYGLREEAIKRKESTIQRKLVEAFLARRIEKHYKKDEILGFYVNRIYLGSSYYGIRSAALGYYGKEPMDLEPQECASIVALIKSPNPLSPLRNPSGNKNWRNFVLARMGKEGSLSKAEVARLQALPLGLNPKPLLRGTTHLYERIFDGVKQALGEEALAKGGFKVHTTILRDAQEAAQKSLEESLVRAEQNPLYRRQKHADYKRASDKPPEYVQGAVLMVDHTTGEVLAHVGGRDYAQSNYDFIELGKRPPGTAFFPFLYAAALASGQTPSSMVLDDHMDNRTVMVGGQEGIVGEWGQEVRVPQIKRKNIPLREAFESSKIAASLRLGQQVGLQKVVDAAVAFGFPMQKTELLPRLCVGWEQVSMKQAVRAIATFGKEGRAGASELVYIDRVEDSRGAIVYRRPRVTVTPPQIVDSATAFQVHSMMVGGMERGAAAGALDGLVEKPFPGAGKGGTTHDFSDNWFLGYNKRVSCGVWTGFLSGAGDPIYEGAFSRDLALPVWQAVMNAASPSFGGGEIKVPPTVVEVPVCAESGQRATQFCQHAVENRETGTVRMESMKVTEYFRKGTENLPFCSVHSGMMADGLTPNAQLGALSAVDVSPVAPKEPVLLGDDPYHTETPSFAPSSGAPGLIRKRTNVLDSLDIGEGEERFRMKRPPRLVIEED
ncbi:MAG: transglycosylase domain-containing protein [Akkermansiaceae bacterium]|nr:transglycosylase domain-containing protein [Akkermansiaceae bacterium]